MNWIKTETISVPAHANTTTEVNINEWFQANRSFLLGTPVANQLRGTAGGWVQTMAIAPEPGQNTIALLRDRLSQILLMVKGDVSASPLNKPNAQGDSNIMATVIPADKFESNSPYAFILRENPKASGIEIHFPPDSKPDSSFLGRIAAEGFKQAHSNTSLWYHNQFSPELMKKARSWVKSCQKFGAYEMDSSEPVEQTKSRRRGGGKTNGSKPSEPTPTPSAASATPVVGNKLVDAVCDRVQQMLDTLKQELVVKPDTAELDALRAENEQLKAELQKSLDDHRQMIEKLDVLIPKVEELEKERNWMQETISQQRETIDKVVSVADNLGVVVEERDRTITTLRQQLAEWGVETEAEPAAPVFEDEPEVEAPVFDDEPPIFDDEPAPTDAPSFDDEVEDLGESPSPSESPSEPDATEEDEPLDLDSLGEV